MHHDSWPLPVYRIGMGPTTVKGPGSPGIKSGRRLSRCTMFYVNTLTIKSGICRYYPKIFVDVQILSKLFELNVMQHRLATTGRRKKEREREREGKEGRESRRRGHNGTAEIPRHLQNVSCWQERQRVREAWVRVWSRAWAECLGTAFLQAQLEQDLDDAWRHYTLNIRKLSVSVFFGSVSPPCAEKTANLTNVKGSSNNIWLAAKI